MKLLTRDGKEIKELDLGIVEAGTSKKYEYLIYNDAEVEVTDIKVLIGHDEVQILDFPKELESKQKGSLTIKWSPSLTLKRGLQTLIKLAGTELYR